MDHTLNYNLKKPLSTTNVRISDINENMDILDTKLKEVDSKVDNIDFSTLQTQIDKKADKVHTHTISDVTNLQTTLDSKATKEEVNAHLGEIMPHKFVDGGKTYRWGFRTVNGAPQFVYEEVI